MKRFLQTPKTRSTLTRIALVALMLVVLVSSMTSCMSGAGRITTIKKGYTISTVTEENGLTAAQLDKLADAIAASKSGFDIREQLVAALNGYDMSAEDFDDAKVADGTLKPQPEKTAEFALNVLDTPEFKLDTDACKKVSNDKVEIVLTAADVQTLVNCFQIEVQAKATLGWLDQILHWIGLGFAWLIQVPGFGSFILGTVYFAIILEIVMLPLGINQQKNSRKQARLRPKEMAIRNKYKGRNDQATQQKVTQEIQELYAKEGYSPMSGCLPLLLMLPFLMALYYVVIDPMTYIFGAPTELTSAFLTFADAPRAAGGLGLELGSNRGTIEVLSLIRESGISLDGLANFGYFVNAPECLEALGGLTDSIPSFSLFGINLGLTPGFENPILLIMPVLTFVVYWASGKLTRKFSFQPMQQAADGQKDPAQGCSNGMMNIMMPAMSAWFTFMVPAAVGLYWMFKSVLGTVKQFVLYKVMPMPTFTEEDYKAAERELMGKEAHKPAKRDPNAPRNPNVRSLHHIDDEDYETPAEREARLAARKRDYVEPEDETPAEPKTAEGAFGDGVTLKEDDRPARKDKKNKKDSDD